MKIREVILRAMAGKLKWWEAAEILGVTDRTMRRWRERYEEHWHSCIRYKQFRVRDDGTTGLAQLPPRNSEFSVLEILAKIPLTE